MNYSPEKSANELRDRLGVTPKLISVEISNSQGKRFGEGEREPLIVHAAWTSDIEPLAIGKGTADSPQIKTENGDLIWFGEKPAQGKHQSIATSFSDKSEMARHLIMPLLLPTDNGNVRLVISHHSIHDPVIEARLKTQLVGQHHFIRNGHEVDVIPIELMNATNGGLPDDVETFRRNVSTRSAITRDQHDAKLKPIQLNAEPRIPICLSGWEYQSVFSSTY